MYFCLQVGVPLQTSGPKHRVIHQISSSSKRWVVYLYSVTVICVSAEVFHSHVEIWNTHCWQLDAVRAEADGGLIVTDAKLFSQVASNIRQTLVSPADSQDVGDRFSPDGTWWPWRDVWWLTEFVHGGSTDPQIIPWTENHSVKTQQCPKKYLEQDLGYRKVIISNNATF